MLIAFLSNVKTFRRIDLFFLAVVIVVFPVFGFCQNAKEIKRFKIKAAQARCGRRPGPLYVINSSSTTKHLKEDGREVARWGGKVEAWIYPENIPCSLSRTR